nr:TetR/AcrR family transcriptional regulator [Alicyclobacillus sp. TC]
MLAAARKLFSEKGYHGTTIREIAEERGILSGSLYAHIDSKEDLLFAIADEGANAFIDALTPVLEKDVSAAEKLRLGLAAHIGVIAHRLEAARVFFHEWHALGKERRQEILEKRLSYEAMWDEILQQGISQGEFSADGARFARLLILSVANWVYQWYSPNGSHSPEQIAHQFSALILHGIAANHEDKLGRR